MQGVGARVSSRDSGRDTAPSAGPTYPGSGPRPPPPPPRPQAPSPPHLTRELRAVPLRPYPQA